MEFASAGAFVDAFSWGNDRARYASWLLERAKAGEVDTLRAVWSTAKSEAEVLTGDDAYRLHTLLENVELSLVAAGTSPALRLLVELLRKDCPRPSNHLVTLAGWFAQAADAESIDALAEVALRLPQPLVLNALQAAVVLGVDVSRSRAAASAWRSRSAGHPMAMLPLVPLEAETGLSRQVPRYSAGGWARRGREARPIADPSVWSADDEVLPIRSADPMPYPLPAVQTWVEDSNGEFAGMEVAFSRPVHRIASAHLLKLGLEALVGVDELELEPASLSDVVEQLFSASLGSAYGATPGVGDARLSTWASVGLLAGANPSAPPSVLEVAGSRQRWATFGPVGPWFGCVAWDLGVVCLREDGRSMMIFAATDTD